MSEIRETVITPKKGLFELNLKQLWQYRDLLFQFVTRDVITIYKQTILGPLWYLIQPLFTSVIFTLIFNNIAGIQTGIVNAFLFNLAGIVVWNYFADCINGTADTFKKNENIFGKVYFPRLIMPLSVILSNLVKLAIQIIIFLCFYIFFFFKGEAGQLGWEIIYFPIVVFIMGFMGLGLGMIISSLTTKYRDLIFLVTFGVQLLMYLSAVMYPITLAQEKLPSQLASFVTYNPIAIVIDSLRKMTFFNGANFSIMDLVFPVTITLIVFVSGLLMFNKTEKSFIDTI